jgi:hypothetical protein
MAITQYLHNVVSIKISTVKEQSTEHGAYGVREIIIETKDGKVEILCFSEHKSMLDESDFIPVKV